jgi:hypothetical protein
MANEKRRQVRAVASKLLKLFGKNGEHWIRGRSAADKNGRIVEPRSRRAVRWCLAGALNKLRLPTLLLTALGDEIKGVDYKLHSMGALIEFNDSHKTYTHVRRFLEKIVKRASKE